MVSLNRFSFRLGANVGKNPRGNGSPISGFRNYIVVSKTVEGSDERSVCVVCRDVKWKKNRYGFPNLRGDMRYQKEKRKK